MHNEFENDTFLISKKPMREQDTMVVIKHLI